MAYERQFFTKGQVLTAEEMNELDAWLAHICGREITAAETNSRGELVFTFRDGGTLNVGEVGGVNAAELTEAVEKALQEAKESGEFDGEPGKPGAPGASGVYVGTGTPTDNAVVWVNPVGEPTATEDWEFDLDDGSTDTKTVVVIGSDDATANGRLAILKLRQPDGSWLEIPGLKGTKGDPGTCECEPELADIRVGYDSTTYPTAGEAVRAQFGKLSEEIGGIKGDDSYTVTSGSFVAVNGAFVEDTTGNPSVISDIPVIGGTVITLTLDSVLYAGTRGYAFYRADGSPYTSATGNKAYTVGVTTYTINVPEDAVSFAFTNFGSGKYKIENVCNVTELSRKANRAYAEAVKDKYVNAVSLETLEKQTNSFVAAGIIQPHEQYDLYTMPVYAGTIVKIRPGFTHASVGYRFVDALNALVDKGAFSGAANATYDITVPNSAAYIQFSKKHDTPLVVVYLTSATDVGMALNKVHGEALRDKYIHGINLESLEKQTNCFVAGGIVQTHEQYDLYTMDVYAGTKVKVIPNFTHVSVGYRFVNSLYGLVSKGAYSDDTESVYELAVPDGATYLQFSQKHNVPIQVDYLTSANDVGLALHNVRQTDKSDPYYRLNSAPTFITMFRKIGCIGDSLTAGTFNTDDSGVYIPEFGYPANLAKMTGVETLNFGVSGSTAARGNRGWRDMISDTSLTRFTENPCDMYIIALGTNDIGSLGAFTGTVDDSGVMDTTTSVGGYCEIIRSIYAMQPRAKVFVVTIPTSRNTADTRAVANAKIKEIAEYYNAYVIDLENHDAGDFATVYKNGSHNNALGYNLRARQYIAYIDWIIENNLNDFRNVAFIGTDYDFTS